MNADEREEIAASLAAHAELGPRYDAAVAEGLVERIGAEIDKRVDARLRGGGHPVQPKAPHPAAAPIAPPQMSPSHLPPPYLPPPQMSPLPFAGPPPPPAPMAQPGHLHRSTAATVMGTILALGSMGLGVGATAVVTRNAGPGTGFMVFFIWLAIIIINGAHARFYWRPDDLRHRRKG